MLVIDPDICIDCGVCEVECPIEAILPDTKENAVAWLELNREYAKKWPNIVRKKEAPSDADVWAKVQHKLEYFSKEPPAK